MSSQVQRCCTALAMVHIHVKQPKNRVFEVCIRARHPSTTPLGLIISGFINNYKRYPIVFSQVQRCCTALAMVHIHVKQPKNSVFEVCIRASNTRTTPLDLIFSGFIKDYKRYPIVFSQVQRCCTALSMVHIHVKQPKNSEFEVCIRARHPSTTPLGLIISGFINNYKRYPIVFSQVQRCCTALAMVHIHVKQPKNSEFEVCIRARHPRTTPLDLIFSGFIKDYKR